MLLYYTIYVCAVSRRTNVFVYLCICVFVWCTVFGKIHICVCALARRTNSYVHVASFELFDHLLCTRAKNALQWHFFIPQIIHFSQCACILAQLIYVYLSHMGQIWHTETRSNVKLFIYVSYWTIFWCWTDGDDYSLQQWFQIDPDAYILYFATHGRWVQHIKSTNMAGQK